MKTIIPVDEENEDTTISGSFGRAPYYMMYDTVDGTVGFIRNTATDNPSGAGVEAAQIVVDSGAGVLITPRCGSHAHGVLRAAGIAVLKAMPGAASDNVKVYLEGGLPTLDDPHEGRHGAH